MLLNLRIFNLSVVTESMAGSLSKSHRENVICFKWVMLLKTSSGIDVKLTRTNSTSSVIILFTSLKSGTGGFVPPILSCLIVWNLCTWGVKSSMLGNTSLASSNSLNEKSGIISRSFPSRWTYCSWCRDWSIVWSTLTISLWLSVILINVLAMHVTFGKAVSLL